MHNSLYKLKKTKVLWQLFFKLSLIKHLHLSSLTYLSRLFSSYSRLWFFTTVSKNMSLIFGKNIVFCLKIRKLENFANTSENCWSNLVYERRNIPTRYSYFELMSVYRCLCISSLQIHNKCQKENWTQYVYVQIRRSFLNLKI